MSAPLDVLHEAMAADGIVFDGSLNVEADTYQRFPCLTKGDRNLDVWVYIYPSLRWAKYGVFGMLEAKSVRLSDVPLTRQDRIRMYTIQHERRIAALNARNRAVAIWDRCEAADPAHPYLVRKQLPPWYCAQLGRDLVTGVYGMDGQIMSLQRITPDGKKQFLSGAHTKGGFLPIGKPGTPTIRFCEGFATGLSIHLATDDLTIACYSAYNLPAVVKSFRGAFPDKSLIICSDRGRVGWSAARSAAKGVGGVTILSPLNPSDVRAFGISDFNDVYVNFGMEALAGQMYRHQWASE